jgi:hypothetical protein
VYGWISGFSANELLNLRPKEEGVVYSITAGTEAVDANGRFIDQLWVGCPSTGGSCGTDQFISKWSWCPLRRAAVPLASNTYHIHHSFVFVDGGSQFGPGTQLFP